MPTKDKEKRRAILKRYYERNKEKILAISKKWQKDNKDRVRENARKVYKKNPKAKIAKVKKWATSNKEKYKLLKKKYRLKAKAKNRNMDRIRNLKVYGLTIAMYDQMFARQNGLCAICGKPELTRGRSNLSVDHNHKTKKVRELLCQKCNHAIGLLGEDKALLQKAIDYLNKHEGVQCQTFSDNQAPANP